ncbi:CPBP family intramembrane glutamic endopeptidase [Anaeroselena agilis]|uniref:CPBP family intramembrane metalloprotease n=1 Tax=Anaeroselena agilis TaxID=3063788 RepID=A0ABU3NTV3_9FIRM|nr:CPBP family intramembrane metalloprotease [Selenomonadales bacterium 4137-cl]
MQRGKAPWSIRDVALVHLMRLAVGFFVVRFIYPLFFAAPPPVVEVTDRLVVIGLVWFAVRRHGGTLASWGLAFARPARNLAAGLGGGVLLLAASLFTERIYTTALFLSPTQHPLVAMVEQAFSWRDLLLPLFLAGLAAPVAEEVLYRLFTFTALRDRFGLWGGAAVSAAIFALFHFNPYWLAEMVVVGVGLAFLYHWTGSLLASIVAHSFINTTKIAMLFYNVPLI